MPVGAHLDSESVIIALDLGTTGNRAIAFDKNGKLVCQSYQEFSQKFPKPGWVEHDPIEIYDTTKAVLKAVYNQLPSKSVVGIGIANQRETVVMWDKVTGKPLYNAIVWQCRRTSQRCDELSHHRYLIKQKTGLPIDPYFSATKIEWLLTHCAAVDRSRILVGTIDSWVVWQLTNKTVHITDHSNASRTMLYNIHTHDYDPELLELFQIPRHILPEIGDSSGKIAAVDPQILGEEIPINAIIGDQQAALFCQCGTDSTALKNTYGTGLFVMASTGSTCIETPDLISTIAWSISKKRAYALEGSVFGGGSTIQWLRDGLKMISTAAETDAMAASIDHNEGVYFVPALAGLGAPHWDPFARGMIIGLTRGTTTAHIARAALESIAYQTADVVQVMNSVVSGVGFGQLLVDGGAVENEFLIQFQSDVLNMPVHRPRIIETTAFGAALMAGLANGVWTERDIRRINPIVHTVNPSADYQLRQDDYARWKAAVTRCLGWDAKKKSSETMPVMNIKQILIDKMYKQIDKDCEFHDKLRNYLTRQGFEEEIDLFEVEKDKSYFAFAKKNNKAYEFGICYQSQFEIEEDLADEVGMISDFTVSIDPLRDFFSQYPMIGPIHLIIIENTIINRNSPEEARKFIWQLVTWHYQYFLTDLTYLYEDRHNKVNTLIKYEIYENQMQNVLLAVFDIQGFTNSYKKHLTPWVYCDLLKIIEYVLNNFNTHYKIDIKKLIIQDTFVFYIEGQSDNKEIMKFLAYCESIYDSFLSGKQKYCVSCAVAYGEVCLLPNKKNPVHIFGKPFFDAFKLCEKKENKTFTIKLTKELYETLTNDEHNTFPNVLESNEQYIYINGIFHIDKYIEFHEDNLKHVPNSEINSKILYRYEKTIEIFKAFKKKFKSKQ